MKHCVQVIFRRSYNVHEAYYGDQCLLFAHDLAIIKVLSTVYDNVLHTIARRFAATVGVRIKRPGFGDNRMPLNRGVGARCVLRLLRHVVSPTHSALYKQQGMW